MAYRRCREEVPRPDDISAYIKTSNLLVGLAVQALPDLLELAKSLFENFFLIE